MGNVWLKYPQLGPPDKGRAIIELVVCWVLPYLIPWAIEQFKVAWRGLEREVSPDPQVSKITQTF